LFDSIELNVMNNNLIYFSFSSYSTTMGKSKIITLNFNQMLDLSTVTVISIECDDEVVEIIPTENKNEFEVHGIQQGQSDISIKILAKRNNKSDTSQYVASTKIIVESDNLSNNSTMIIVISIILGIILLVGVVWCVKTVVRDRKNDVK